MSSPAAWHPDPLGRHEHRYWDGTRWTEHVADGGVSGHDPIEAPPTASSMGATQPTATAGAGSDPASQTPAATATTPAAEAPADAGNAPTTGEAHAPPSPSPSPAAGGEPPAAQPPQQPAAQQPAAQQPPQGTWQAGAPASQPPATNGLAVAAMIFGILSLLVSWVPFVGLLGVVGGALALVLGLLGRGRAKKVANGAGLAVTGIITGLLAVLVGIASTVLPVLFFQGMVGDFEAVDRCIEQTGNEQACIEEHAPGWVRFLDGLDD
jgi:hypothetical protein